MDVDNPAHRAAIDRNAAFAIAAITSQARKLAHLDSAEAIQRLDAALTASRASRNEFASVLAALAVHTVRAEQLPVLPQLRTSDDE